MPPTFNGTVNINSFSALAGSPAATYHASVNTGSNLVWLGGEINADISSTNNFTGLQVAQPVLLNTLDFEPFSRYNDILALMNDECQLGVSMNLTAPVTTVWTAQYRAYFGLYTLDGRAQPALTIRTVPISLSFGNWDVSYGGVNYVFIFHGFRMLDRGGQPAGGTFIQYYVSDDGQYFVVPLGAIGRVELLGAFISVDDNPFSTSQVANKDMKEIARGVYRGVGRGIN